MSWVHLSDIHMGHGDASNQWDQAMVLDSLLEDLRQLRGSGRGPSPQLLFVTGDIGFSGGAKTPRRGGDEYALARAWLGRVQTLTEIPSERVFMVPGNHDVDRSADSNDPQVRRLLGVLRSGAEPLDEALGDTADEALLRQRMARFLDFSQGFGPRDLHREHGGLWWRSTLDLPHDVKLRLCGLNTAILAADDEDRGHLRVGGKQLAELLCPSPSSLEVVLVLSHHPASQDWLADQSSARRRLNNSAHLHLYGHLHTPESRQIGHGWGVGCAEIAAGAAHAEGGPSGSDPTGHSYNLGTLVVLESGELAVRVWPRKWSEVRGSFVADVDNVDPEKGFAEHRLRRRIELPPSLASAPRGLEPGQRVGEHYQLIEIIGRGGVGQVWKAVDTRSGDTVALKVLNPDKGPSGEAKMATFFRGAAAMARLETSSVVRVLAPRIEHRGFSIYAMQYIDGDSLGALYRGHAVPEAEAIDMLLTVGAGLDAAHAARIVHRDLKPSNVLRSRHGQLFIIDFDTARLIDEGATTQTGGRLATLAYAAPEVLASLHARRSQAPREGVDLRADIYSLAMLAIFLLTGEDPEARYINRMHEFIATLDVSADLRDILAHAAAHDQAERFTSVRALMNALRSVHKAPRVHEPRAPDRPSDVPALTAAVTRQPPITSSGVLHTAPTMPSRGTHLSGQALTVDPKSEPPTASGSKLPTVFSQLPTHNTPPADDYEPPTSDLVGQIHQAYERHGAALFVAGGFLLLVAAGLVILASAALSVPCPDDMVLIGGGRLGDDPIPRFCMDRTEVTVEVFRSVVLAKGIEQNSTQTKTDATDPIQSDRHCNLNYADRGEHPVNCVDRKYARAYCERVGKRLPTAMEWEWAAQGQGLGRRYPWGHEEPRCALAVILDPDNACTHGTQPVGSKPRGGTADGLLDMAGNVWEWTSTERDGRAIVVGGGWSSQAPEGLSKISRTKLRRPQDRENATGFRCTKSLDK